MRMKPRWIASVIDAAKQIDDMPLAHLRRKTTRC